MQHSHKRGYDLGRIEGTWETCKNQAQKNPWNDQNPKICWCTKLKQIKCWKLNNSWIRRWSMGWKNVHYAMWINAT
jgi:hypothetical protein